MPNKESAKKALRQTAKRTQRNKIAKAEIRSMRVAFRKALEAKDNAKAGDLAKTIGKKLDKAQARGILKKGTVARYKSRLMTKLNSFGKA